MKHWDERDVTDVRTVRLTRAERKRLRALFAQVPDHRRDRSPPHVGSLIGVALSFAVLVGIAWAIVPADPVSPKILP
jgi:hypothetical protein